MGEQFDREAWLPLARVIYEDNDREYEPFEPGDLSGPPAFERLVLGRQNGYIDRALEYAALVPRRDWELRTEHSVRYRDTATVYMSGEIAYHYTAPFPDRYRAELMLEQVKKRGPDREDAVVVTRETTEWRVENDGTE